MSFPRNDGHLIEQLEQQYHGMIIVLYTKNCQSYAASLNQKGIKTILFDKKTLLIYGDFILEVSAVNFCR